MVPASVQIEPSKVVPTASAFEELSQRPHFPVDFPPLQLLLSQNHHIFIQVPFGIFDMLTSNLTICSYERCTFNIFAEQVRGLSLSVKLIADHASIQQIQGILKENLQLFLVQPRHKQVFWIMQCIELFDRNFLSQLLGYVTFVRRDRL